MNVLIEELSNTFGCVWIDDNNKMNFGFKELPGATLETKTYLSASSGYAVDNILENVRAAITETFTGAYGGKKRRISVSIEELNIYTAAYWAREEARDTVLREHCHYCGGHATSTGFFDEPVCAECG